MIYRDLYNSVLQSQRTDDDGDNFDLDKAARLRSSEVRFIPTNNEALNRAVIKLGAHIQYNVPLRAAGENITSPTTNMATGDIFLPHPDSFHSPDDYAHTVAHEICHSLRRQTEPNHPASYTMFDKLFSDVYDSEEVAAEMTAALFEQATIGRMATPHVTLVYLRSYLVPKEVDSEDEFWERAELRAQARLAILMDASK